MKFPIRTVGGGVVAFVVGMLVGRKVVPSVWEKVKERWSPGTRFAILGAQGVGKSSLVAFLTSGSIPAKSLAHTGPRPVQGKSRHLREFKWKVAETLDIPGHRDYLPACEELVRGSEAVGKKRPAARSGQSGDAFQEPAQVVIYTLRVDHAFGGDANTIQRIRRDGEHIEKWLGMCPSDSRPRFIVMGTFGDTDVAFNGHSVNRKAHEEYRRRFRQIPAVHELVLRGGGERCVDVLVGSLKTQEDAEDLVVQLLEKLGADRR